MGNSLAEVFSLALSACGSTFLVDDPDENTLEAQTCRLWLPRSRDMIAMTAPWPCARAYARLSLVATRANEHWSANDPSPAYLYAYQPPSDMLVPLHFQSYGYFEYVNGKISSGEPSPILYYNRRVEDVTEWDPLFYDAVVHYLAAKLAVPLKGDPALISRNWEIAQMQIEAMRVEAANIMPQQMTSMPDFISVRGYSGSEQARFFYPLNNLSALASA